MVQRGTHMHRHEHMPLLVWLACWCAGLLASLLSYILGGTSCQPPPPIYTHTQLPCFVTFPASRRNAHTLHRWPSRTRTRYHWCTDCANAKNEPHLHHCHPVRVVFSYAAFRTATDEQLQQRPSQLGQLRSCTDDKRLTCLCRNHPSPC